MHRNLARNPSSPCASKSKRPHRVLLPKTARPPARPPRLKLPRPSRMRGEGCTGRHVHMEDAARCRLLYSIYVHTSHTPYYIPCSAHPTYVYTTNILLHERLLSTVPTQRTGERIKIPNPSLCYVPVRDVRHGTILPPYRFQWETTTCIVSVSTTAWTQHVCIPPSTSRTFVIISSRGTRWTVSCVPGKGSVFVVLYLYRGI